MTQHIPCVLLRLLEGLNPARHSYEEGTLVKKITGDSGVRRMVNEKGFTLIELIAVLVILGVLGFVAVPRLIDLTSNARARASEGAIAQAKSMLSLAYAKYLLENKGKIPTGNEVISLIGVPANGNLDLGPDFRLTFTNQANRKRIRIVVTRFQGKNVPSAQRVSDFWYYPN